VYIAKNRSIKVKTMIYTESERVEEEALLDSGATECFIHPRFATKYNLCGQMLDKPRHVRNVDGTTNRMGQIREEVLLMIQYRDTITKHRFLLADIGEDNLILGYPFFEAGNPNINWTDGTIDQNVTLSALEEWEELPENMLFHPRIAKVTMAQQLAEQAADQKVRTWQEIVPRRYHRHGKVFSEQASERFPGPRPWDHAIDLKQDAPTSINCRVYPMAPKEKDEQKKFLEANLQLQRIRRSNSPYASGFFFIKKKDGKYRPVQDYRQLNKWTIPNKYPLPLIAELVHDLAGKKLFSKFDVRWGYNNIRIKKGDEWKAAFKTSEGLFEPTVMFFGLTNSPATFRTMMDDVFREEISQGWLRIYMDDAVIATEDDERIHGERVNHFLDKLAKHNLFLKPEKCSFHVKEVKYLGVIIGNGKVKMDPIKVEGIANWPTPQTVKEVRSFLGFCNFYRAFIPSFSHTARPLNDLTKKGIQWNWTTKEQKAFDELKRLCTVYPVLQTPDWEQPFIMETDASGYALGAVLMQEFEDGVHPIAFHSRSLLPAERNYDAHDKELAGVVYGFKCGRPFLLGAKHAIRVRTDHKNLQYFRQPQKINGRQAGWFEYLQDFDYTLEHIPGSSNTIADLLSRHKDLDKGVNTDEPRILLPDKLFKPHDFPTNFTQNRKIYLPDNTTTRREAIKQLHDTPTAGHPGIANTWNLVKRQYEGP